MLYIIADSNAIFTVVAHYLAIMAMIPYQSYAPYASSRYGPAMINSPINSPVTVSNYGGGLSPYGGLGPLNTWSPSPGLGPYLSPYAMSPYPYVEPWEYYDPEELAALAYENGWTDHAMQSQMIMMSGPRRRSSWLPGFHRRDPAGALLSGALYGRGFGNGRFGWGGPRR